MRNLKWISKENTLLPEVLLCSRFQWKKVLETVSSRRKKGGKTRGFKDIVMRWNTTHYKGYNTLKGYRFNVWRSFTTLGSAQQYYSGWRPRYTVISPGYKIPGYFSELSSGKYTAQFKNFTTARMHRHMYGFQWHFGVIFPSQDTIWSIILFTMYYFTAINIFLSLHYTEILNSIIIPSIPYRTRHARSLSLRATQFWEKTNSQQTLTYDDFMFLTDLLIQHSPDL